ncbi:MAG TPA: T9SS type A sorting domain-containing protein [Bacteroidia bacterium]|nr:T9SS type A sorting domain-containing protein [Bacteroidia bacterium]HRS57681.1 T9SS type A sorting domain-containing protein [Bacteroidia bacterium]HRU67104.1 T9SS type A sorting domain-containing protein [Bacteroidia bacterium]
MRNILFCFSLVFISFLSNAQCIPDSFSKPNIYPDTIRNLDTAYANQYYEMKMTAVIPVDTLVFGNRMPIDSIGLISLTGLPASLSYVSNSLSGYWKGGTSGCILISGTPQNNENGVYPLNIMVRAFVAGVPADYPVKGYKIVVIGNSSINKSDLSHQVSFYPNPSFDIASLRFYSSENAETFIILNNSIGKIIRKIPVTISAGHNSVLIPVSDLPKGNYFLQININQQIITFPFIKY